MDTSRKMGIGALLVAATLTGGALGANFLGVAERRDDRGFEHHDRGRAARPQPPTRVKAVTWPTGSPRPC